MKFTENVKSFMRRKSGVWVVKSYVPIIHKYEGGEEEWDNDFGESRQNGNIIDMSEYDDEDFRKTLHVRNADGVFVRTIPARFREGRMVLYSLTSSGLWCVGFFHSMASDGVSLVCSHKSLNDPPMPVGPIRSFDEALVNTFVGEE